MECPQCKSNSTYHRSTTDDFRCHKCGFEFKKSGESSKVAQAVLAGDGSLLAQALVKLVQQKAKTHPKKPEQKCVLHDHGDVGVEHAEQP